MKISCLLLLAGIPSAPLGAQTPLGSYSDAFIQRYRRTDPQIDYTVTVPANRSAYLIELRIENAPNPARLVIPNWAPGAYRIMSSGQNISAFTATDGTTALTVTQDSPISWTVNTKGASNIVVRYRTALPDSLAWRRPNNRWFLRATSGVIDGPRTFMYLDGWKLTPSHVAFRLPGGWHIATGLVATTDSTVYWAPSYDVLIDSPVLLGHFLSYPFTAAGRPHRAVVDLGGIRASQPRVFVDMLRRISETAAQIFGNAPYKDYTYIFVAGRGGGLEHLNSTTIGVSSETLAKNPRNAESVSAHEFFHAWNVKRIRPLELGPFDYEREAYTRSLWAVEGITEYYGHLLLHRAGLTTREEYLEALSEKIESLQTTPGRLVQSAAQASFDAWIKLYRPDENTPNTSVSYYTKGAVIAFLLDALIRHGSRGTRSLDDVMRAAYQEFSGPRGFTVQQFRGLLEDAAGRSLSKLWADAIDGTAELKYAEALDYFGLRFKPDSALPERQRAWLGAATKIDEGRLVVTQVKRGTPASKAGLNVDDELIAIDDLRVRADRLDQRLEQYAPGERVSLLVARREQLVQLTLTFGAEPPRLWRLEVDPIATPAQAERLHSWLKGVVENGVGPHFPGTIRSGK